MNILLLSESAVVLQIRKTDFESVFIIYGIKLIKNTNVLICLAVKSAKVSHKVSFLCFSEAFSFVFGGEIQWLANEVGP